MDAPWPRSCANCHNTSYVNPLPVAVLLLPVVTEGITGLLTIRRAIQPKLGELALPGGFMDMRETWQQACARELHEEAEIEVDPGLITLFTVHTALEGMILVFGLAPAIAVVDLPPFRPTPEVSERVILTHALELAFPLHTLATRQFFNK